MADVSTFFFRLFDLAGTCDQDTMEDCECETAEILLLEGEISCATIDERFLNPPACPSDCPVCEVRNLSFFPSFLGYPKTYQNFHFSSSAWWSSVATIFINEFRLACSSRSKLRISLVSRT